VASIFYSMAGEGRGHATRVRTVTDALRGQHEITLLAPGDAYELLADAYRGASDVRIQRLPGLRFAYDAKHKVAPLRTARLVTRYLWSLGQILDDVADLMRFHRADLLLTDYDPGGPRAAERAGVPYVALDHQSFFTYSDLSWLPGRLRRRAWFVKRINHALYHGQRHTISSSFFRPDPLPGARDVTFVGSMLRAPIRAATPTTGDHVVAYCRRQVQENVLDALAAASCPVHVFGLGEREPRGAIEFFPVSEAGFIESLCSARAVVASAGNQLLGEALYLGKPFLALPEVGQYEQEINVAWLERMGAGVGLDPRRLDLAFLNRFLDECDRYRDVVDREFAAGNAAAVAAIETQLERL
jgi:uncharacterized protein (TIGR00661 family)